MSWSNNNWVIRKTNILNRVCERASLLYLITHAIFSNDIICYLVLTQNFTMSMIAFAKLQNELSWYVKSISKKNEFNTCHVTYDISMYDVKLYNDLICNTTWYILVALKDNDILQLDRYIWLSLEYFCIISNIFLNINFKICFFSSAFYVCEQKSMRFYLCKTERDK